MRLIDADALSEELYHVAFETDGNSKWDSGCWVRYKVIERLIHEQPVAPITIHGYNITHLGLIATVLQKQGLSPDRVEEALTNISGIIDMVKDEYEKSLRKAIDEVII